MQEVYNDTMEVLSTFRNTLSSHLQNKWPDIIVEFLLADKVRAFYRCDPVRFLCATTEGAVQGGFCGQRHSVAIMVIET